jgi:cell wall-associated NlpC family hydrolase
MVSIANLQFECPYHCLTDLNLYQSPERDSLVTQAAAGRQLQVLHASEPNDRESSRAVYVRLREDDYLGWVKVEDLAQLAIAPEPYAPTQYDRAAIEAKLPEIIAFTQAAMAQPNTYLWGGTVGPNYDCSGLMQAAFASVGIWIPRDAYQQEAFTQPIAIADLYPGDLVFFGPPEKATHVGLYLGERQYIHSSGRDQGRNGIGLDQLAEQGDTVSQTYYRQLRGAGRVMSNYQPKL